jgi:hypothetical protein
MTGADMAPNSFVYSHLSKRRSTPTSPVSPLPKPDGAFGTLDSPEAPSSPPTRHERPPTERQNPSSRFRVPSFSETSLDLSFDPNLAIPSRFSDEHKRYKPRSPPERPRPSTSAAASRETDRSGKYFAIAPAFEPLQKTEASDVKWSVEQPASSPSEPSASHNRAPRVWREYSSSDNLPTSAQSPKTPDAAFYSGREDQRNVSGSPLMMERVAGEDAGGHKVSSSRFGKGRLNLLNPKILLGRRRAPQTQSKPDEVVSATSLAVPAMPDDYDPRIWGKIVHDFSAPRPRRIQSYQGQSAENSPLGESRPFEDTGRRASDLPGLVDGVAKRNAPLSQYSPLFKEHFNDDRQALQPGYKAYLHSFAASSVFHGDLGHASLPAFAKKLPVGLPNKHELEKHNRPSSPQDSEAAGAIPAPVVVSEVAAESQNQVAPPIAHPTRPPPPPPVPQSSTLEDHKREHLPKHMTSTSSRFSFQLGGVDSAAQERILEEKHKQQLALKRPVDEPEVDEDVQDDDYENYDPDADDDLEEKIPGVNADLEELDEDAEETADGRIARSEQVAKTETFHFTPASTILSPTTTNATSQPTPRDEMGQVIGFANTTDSPNMGQPLPPDRAGDNDGDSLLTMLNGLGITSIEGPGLEADVPTITHVQRQSDSFDDDMYFDDGNFDDFGVDEETEGFDEAIFDDESCQIPDIPAQNAKNLEAAKQRMPSGLQGTSLYHSAFPASAGTANMPADGKQVSFADPAFDLPHGQTLPSREPPSLDTGQPFSSQRGGLTEGNLAAYHDALVLAANEAAANGRFSRQTSTSQASEDQGSSSQMHDSHPGLVPDDSRVDLDNLGFEEDETFPFDDDVDDDPMIAEANAEVLENDEEGFYGQEFGFYARAHGRGSTEPVNGGYFGPRGGDGIKRSHSAKANFQEPSLTPITERSEWSTRNSVASLPIPNGLYAAQSVQSPGIAQRLDLDSATFDDDEMTLSALIKLRRGAWGGSSTSVNSVGGSHNSNSPLTHLGSRDFGGSSGHMGNGHKVTSSVHSLTDSVGIPESEEEGEDDQPEVLTMRQNTPRKGSSDPHTAPTTQDLAIQSPVSAVLEKGKNHLRGHSRTSSGGESISYVKDPEGSGRWVLERRRTGDDGEFEIVGREYLAGARI